MVLGSELFESPQLLRTIPALGLVPDIIVIPHFDELPTMVVNTMNLGKRKTTVVGIDGSTALVCSQAQWVVNGRGSVTCFTEGQKTRNPHVEKVTLPIALA